MSKVFWPFTPGESALAHLESSTEGGVWCKLMENAAHTSHKTKQDFIYRGYKVLEISGD